MLCFLNCHLPAHMDKAEQRKDNFQTILSLQQFPGPGAHGILDHEYGLWPGQIERGGGGEASEGEVGLRERSPKYLTTGTCTSLGGPCGERQIL